MSPPRLSASSCTMPTATSHLVLLPQRLATFTTDSAHCAAACFAIIADAGACCGGPSERDLGQLKPPFGLFPGRAIAHGRNRLLLVSPRGVRRHRYQFRAAERRFLSVLTSRSRLPSCWWPK